jgi:hypothetical protein
MPDTVQCPGCHLPVDIARPPDVAFQVLRGQNSQGREVIMIDVGLVTVHCCTRCADGEWR